MPNPLSLLSQKPFFYAGISVSGVFPVGTGFLKSDSVFGQKGLGDYRKKEA